MSKSGLLDDDMNKKIQVIEQETSVLRIKVSKLEVENEKLVAENKSF